MGGPCDFSVSPSPFGLDFGTLDFGLGLDNNNTNVTLTFYDVGLQGSPSSAVSWCPWPPCGHKSQVQVHIRFLNHENLFPTSRT